MPHPVLVGFGPLGAGLVDHGRDFGRLATVLVNPCHGLGHALPVDTRAGFLHPVSYTHLTLPTKA